MTLTRRQALTGGVAAMTLLGAGSRAFAQAATTNANEIVLSGGQVVSLDPAVPDLPRGDVHVRDGAIVAVAETIEAQGVARIALEGRVVMPGFVDTHWHMWNTIARGLPSSRLGPFAKTMAGLSKVWTPQASALGVRLAAAEAIASGITTVNNWAHNVKDPQFAAAELEAQRASGLRGRFSYGYPQALQPAEVMDITALQAMAKDFGEGGLVSLGICTRGPDRSEPAAWRREWAVARELRLPITTHIASDRTAAGMGNIDIMADDGLLGPDVQLVHATHASLDQLKRAAEAGSPLSISPWTELEVGYGIPALPSMIESGIEMGLSVDNMVLAGRADMFGVMRLTADLAAGLAESQSALSDRAVLEWATIGGARGLGLGDSIGSLTPGKRADIIAVRADALHTSPAGTVDFMLTHAAQPADVDFVMVDGEIHMQDGRHTRVDVEALVGEANATIAKLREQAGV